MWILDIGHMIADRKVYLGSYTATLLDTLSGRGTRVAWPVRLAGQSQINASKKLPILEKRGFQPHPTAHSTLPHEKVQVSEVVLFFLWGLLIKKLVILKIPQRESGQPI